MGEPPAREGKLGGRGYADAVNRVPRNRAIPPPPSAVRGAGFVVAAQGLAALVMAVVLVVRAIAGADQRVVNGVGTALWFLVIGGVVTVAAGIVMVLKS